MKLKKNIAISNSGFIFNPETGESFSANPIGVQIFNLLKEDKDFSEIKKQIMENYTVDEPTFEKDFNDFTYMLNNYNLIDAEDEEKA